MDAIFLLILLGAMVRHAREEFMKNFKLSLSIVVQDSRFNATCTTTLIIGPRTEAQAVGYRTQFL
jgi:hypothetical protein